MANAAARVERQRWSAEDYAKNARFVSDLATGVLALLDPRPGEKILDLGCGDGALSGEIAASGAAVFGADTSPELLAAARQRGLEVVEKDGQALDFDNEFDAVFSNAALHWMTAAEKVVSGVARALKPGGRFVAEFGGHGNVAAIITAMRSASWSFGGDAALAHPWYFPTPDEYAGLLEAAGFDVVSAHLVPRPTPLPTGIEGWLQTFREPFFQQFGDRRPEVMKHVVELLRPSLSDGAGRWTADYVRLRVKAVKRG